MLTITSNIDGEVNELKLVGRLDVKSAKDADVAFSETAEKSKIIVLDLSELDYVASAGLRALKRLRASVRDNDGELKVRGVQDAVMEVFELTGFAAMFTFE